MTQELTDDVIEVYPHHDKWRVDVLDPEGVVQHRVWCEDPQNVVVPSVTHPFTASGVEVYLPRGRAKLNGAENPDEVLMLQVEFQRYSTVGVGDRLQMDLTLNTTFD